MSSTTVTPTRSASGIFSGLGGLAWEGREEKVGKCSYVEFEHNRSVLSKSHLEHEHVPPLGHGPHVDGVQDLVKLLRLGRAHVDYLPLEVLGQILDALKCDLELERKGF